MRQRLGIAGALIRRPQLFLLDEPATGLDPAGMRDMRALIRSLADSGITVLLSSHLMNEVEELCNRVAIIRAGRIVYEGRARRAARERGRQLHAAHVRRCARRGDLRAPPGHQRLHAARDGVRMRAGEAAIEELSLELAAAGIALRSLVPDAASLEERFFALTEDPEPAPAGRRPSSSRWRDAAHALRLSLGAAQARRAEAHLPRPRRRDIAPRSSSPRSPSRTARRTTSRSATTCATRARRAARALRSARSGCSR